MTSAAAQVLSVAQMRGAEQALIAGGETVSTLMTTAGQGAAEWIWRAAAGRPVTVLCGPGNNGGDGYVIAESLRRRGNDVAVIAPFEPGTDAAREAARGYGGRRGDPSTGGVFVDCLFGSGLSRPLAPELSAMVRDLAAANRLAAAIDLPSGVESDSGEPLGHGLPRYDLTIALGAWKRAHFTMPAMALMGARKLVEIGVAGVDGADRLVTRPVLQPPAADAHKYTRGLVLVVAGSMPGAAVLASEAAMRAGAGAVRLAAESLPPAAPPDIVLRPDPVAELAADERTGAICIGPGLGRDGAALEKLGAALRSGRALVLDADALHIAQADALARRSAPLILTPHEGELDRLAGVFAVHAPTKRDRALQIAQASGAVVIAKGPDTIIAAPNGAIVYAPSATSWLSVAGSGDVLAGIAASRLASGVDAFEAAEQACWLHNEAARALRAPFLASELARAVSGAYAAAL